MKNQLIFLFLFSLLFNSNIFSQCSETDKTKVLLVGDSWAFFMGVDGTLNNVFTDWGHSGTKYYTNAIIAENGAETVDFLEQAKQDEISYQILNNPDIEFVHLSLGGNDVLGNWKVSFTQAQTDSLKSEVKDSLIAVINFIKSVKPGIKILWSGYVYPNFEEVITGSWFPSSHPFYGTWEGMEFPDNQTINNLLNDFSQDIESYYANDPRVSFVNATGLTQYTFGQDQALGVAPFGTYPVFSAMLPQGFTDYPSPKNSMRDYGVTKDCFHLSVQGYKDFISYHTQKYYHKLFMDDKYFIAANDNNSGSVSSNGSVSQDLLLGEQNGESFATVLNFETTLSLDSVVEKASIFLRRKEQIGVNPVSDSMLIEVKSGHFGTTLSLEAVDINSPSDEDGAPCLFGNNTDGNWVRLDLPQEILPFITTNNSTQFKLSAPLNTGALVEFSGTSDPDFAPILNIVYGNTAVTAVEENSLAKSEVNIFPNPVTDMLNIVPNEGTILKIAVYNLLGEEVSNAKTQQVDLSSLRPGSYIVKVQTSKGNSVHKVIKR